MAVRTGNLLTRRGTGKYLPHSPTNIHSEEFSCIASSWEGERYSEEYRAATESDNRDILHIFGVSQCNHWIGKQLLAAVHGPR